MNNILQLKSQFYQRKNPNKPGPANLPVGKTVKGEHIVELTKQLKDIKEPTLVVNGGNDLCTPYIAKYMYDRIPNSKWELFQYCRHMCFVEDNDKYVEMMKEWLNAND